MKINKYILRKLICEAIDNNKIINKNKKVDYLSHLDDDSDSDLEDLSGLKSVSDDQASDFLSDPRHQEMMDSHAKDSDEIYQDRLKRKDEFDEEEIAIDTSNKEEKTLALNGYVKKNCYMVNPFTDQEMRWGSGTTLRGQAYYKNEDEDETGVKDLFIETKIFKNAPNNYDVYIRNIPQITMPIRIEEGAIKYHKALQKLDGDEAYDGTSFGIPFSSFDKNKEAANMTLDGALRWAQKAKDVVINNFLKYRNKNEPLIKQTILNSRQIVDESETFTDNHIYYSQEFREAVSAYGKPISFVTDHTTVEGIRMSLGLDETAKIINKSLSTYLPDQLSHRIYGSIEGNLGMTKSVFFDVVGDEPTRRQCFVFFY